MILDEVLPLPKESRFDVKKHKKQLFGMFIGEEKKVSFEVDNSIFGVVFDKFKKDIKMSLKVGGGYLYFLSNIQVCPIFVDGAVLLEIS